MSTAQTTHDLVNRQKAFFQTNLTKDLKFRKMALNKLEFAIQSYEEEIAAALKADLGKSSFESYMTETGLVLSDLKFIKKRLSCWSRKHYVLSPLAQAPAVSFTMSEPYGTVLIMSPWNYPFQLSIEPLIGAIAAGNTVVLKPSAYSENISAVLKKMLNEIFPEDYVAVIEGGHEANQTLLNEEFDYIFFTGSPTVGKVVLEKAAPNLTPVSLELGGKSPVIIDKTADLDLAAKRIAFGKYLNAGQTCVAPDYILIEKEVEAPFLELLTLAVKKFYGDHPLLNDQYGKIVNEKHFERINGLIQSQNIVSGGKSDPDSMKIEPTILRDVALESAVMQEEIFGPVLPVLTYENLDEAISFIKSREKPLALYLFSESERVQKKVLNEISFGGGCINDTIVHLATSRMPFGGVGHSGMGGYHGKYSFDTFSHKKSIVKKATWFDLPIRYAPYTDFKMKILRMFL